MATGKRSRSTRNSSAAGPAGTAGTAVSSGPTNTATGAEIVFVIPGQRQASRSGGGAGFFALGRRTLCVRSDSTLKSRCAPRGQ